MSSEISKDAVAPMSLDQIRSKIQSALEGGNETLVLPQSDWVNFVRAASGSLESMSRNIDWSKSNVTNSIMARRGFDPSRYLEVAQDNIGSLRPNLASEISNTDMLKIHMKGNSTKPDIIDLNVDCDFVDTNDKAIAYASTSIHFQAPQDGSRWEYYNCNFRTSLDGHSTSFSVASSDSLIPS